MHPAFIGERRTTAAADYPPYGPTLGPGTWVIRTLNDPRTWRELAHRLHDPDPARHDAALALIGMTFALHAALPAGEIARRALAKADQMPPAAGRGGA